MQANRQSDTFMSPVYSVPEIQALIDFVGISIFLKRYSNSFRYGDKSAAYDLQFIVVIKALKKSTMVFGFNFIVLFMFN